MIKIAIEVRRESLPILRIFPIRKRHYLASLEKATERSEIRSNSTAITPNLHHVRTIEEKSS